VDSLLQPAAPSAIRAKAIARGQDDERNAAKEFMSCSLERDKQAAS
jgi:hypothetical protein